MVAVVVGGGGGGGGGGVDVTPLNHSRQNGMGVK